MDAFEHYVAGHLADAIQSATDQVKKTPREFPARWLLAELLCFRGDWERADKQLDMISKQDPQTAMTVALFRQLIRAEMARQEFHSAGRVPEFVDVPTPVLELHIQASIAMREGEMGRAGELLARSHEERPRVRGVCDGQTFDDFRDLDERCAPFFEVFTSVGKYFWIPFERVEKLELRPQERPRDVLWRPASVEVRSGPSGEVFLPTRYPESTQHDDDEIRLARINDWTGGDDGSPIRGVGVRMYQIGEKQEVMPNIELIEFET